MTPHERLAAAGIAHRFTNGRLEVRVMQPGQAAPWWPAVAHAGNLLRLPAAVAEMPEIASAVAAWAGSGGDMASKHVVTPGESPAPSLATDRRKAWKLRNREKVQAQKRRARGRRKVPAPLALH